MSLLLARVDTNKIGPIRSWRSDVVPHYLFTYVQTFTAGPYVEVIGASLVARRFEGVACI